MTNQGHSLPQYTPSLPAPSYSSSLSCGEQLLEQTPRTSTSRSTPTGTYVKKLGNTVLLLNDQEDGVEQPTYGRGGTISGILCFEDSEGISEVVVKVNGKLNVTISEGGSNSTPTVHYKYAVWTATKGEPLCPSQLSFSCPLPVSYDHAGSSRPLPPSYCAAFRGVPALIVKCAYRLEVCITRSRHRAIDFWKTTKRFVVPFKYHPRTRSHRPIIPTDGFFSSIKTLPEEWYQSSSTVKTQPSSELGPIEAHLLVPSARIYGLSDIIPFHLQLSGSTLALRELLQPLVPALNRVTSADSRLSRTSSRASNPSIPKLPVRVYLLRQILVEVRGIKSWRNVEIGEGSLVAVPPDSESDEETLNWEGELRCNDDVSVGGFTTDTVSVKDFIILAVTPSSQNKSQFLPMQDSLPIRLVTDSWADVPGFEWQ
ncbi:hypothetical protein BD779DRAFT_1668859 [Infundibulicybe gibba]|nr:hypothetical protein BD779DRAFT_1668859 [Infundibulicybe gibba]